MLPEATGRGQHFQARVPIFFPIRTTLSRPITFLSFPLTVDWLNTNGVVYTTLPLNRLMRRLQDIGKKSNERLNIRRKMY